MPIPNIAEMLELPILGVIPEDKKFQAALVMKDALVNTHPKTKSASEYRKIAAKISGNHVYKEKVGFFDRLFGR